MTYSQNLIKWKLKDDYGIVAALNQMTIKG
jgi:hypothetical protein